MDAHGYQLGYAPEHPLASKTGLVHEHRVVAYEKYGGGDQKCHWCKTPLTWKQVEVDHLDWNRSNNDKSNLVLIAAEK
ncbi:HNH endonuclease [Sphingobium sp.]|uniref:HNH endonuclease n=1 Tax=Sphingobium sp. TaxID=1912891 RepID=UPI0025E5D42F|nr:HNH endonuclease [Sphingobium sp.]